MQDRVVIVLWSIIDASPSANGALESQSALSCVIVIFGIMTKSLHLISRGSRAAIGAAIRMSHFGTAQQHSLYCGEPEARLLLPVKHHQILIPTASRPIIDYLIPAKLINSGFPKTDHISALRSRHRIVTTLLDRLPSSRLAGKERPYPARIGVSTDQA